MIRASHTRRPRSWRRRLAFVAILLLVMWVMLEVAAFLGYRVLRGEGFSFERLHAAQAARAKILDTARATPDLAFQDSGGDTCIHPYLGFVANRDTDDQMLLPPRGYGVTRYGFVDYEDPVRARRADVVLVGIFGGSVAEFFGEEGADELAQRLRAHRRFGDKRIEFVRLGLGGFKQPQQLMSLSYLLALGGELDVAVNLDGFNEATLGPLENVPRGVAAVFPRNWSLLAEHAPDPRERRLMGTVTVLQDTQRRLAAGIAGGFWRWSVVANVLWDSIDRWIDRQVGARLLQLQQSKRDDLPFHVVGPGVEAGQSADRMADEAVATWARCSRAMHRVCQAHGIAYFHFLQPNQYDDGSKTLTDEERRQAFDPQSRYRPVVSSTYPRLRQAGAELAAQGIAFTDLSGLFRDVAGTLYIDNCCHVNAEGNRRLAHAIAAAIVGRGDGTEPATPPEVRDLRAEPAALRLTAPFEQREVRLRATTSGNADADVSYAPGVTYSSSDTRVAAVDPYGVVTALGAGTARVVARVGDAAVEVEVSVDLPQVVDLDGAYAPPPLHAPRLAATVENGTLVLQVTPPAADLPGAVSFAAEPAPRAFCGGRVFVPLASPKVTPLVASSGEVRVPFTLPDPHCKTVFVQAVYRAGGDTCGFAVSNALAITP
ncbi:MAG: hypothetical protein R3F56_05325 [Planctomycetota bacterium]